MKHTMSVLVENHFGVLARISGLFSGRGFNIESLSVGETEDLTVSRITLVVDGDEAILEQVTKQLNRLVDVIKVSDLTSTEFVEREIALIKVNASKRARSEIMEIADIFRAGIVDVSPATLTIEVTGDEHKIDAIIDLVKEFGIREIARSGKVALARTGKGTLER